MPALPQSRPAKLAVAAFCLLLALAAALWWARDVPRRGLETRLGRAFDAQVRLGGLEVASPRRLILRDLHLTNLAELPIVERLEIAEMEVESDPEKLLEGRWERLHLRGVRARLRPETAFVPRDEPLPVRIGELLLAPAVLVVPAADGDRLLTVEAALRGVGGDLEGEVTVRGDRLPVASVLAAAGLAAADLDTAEVGGEIDGLELRLALGAADGWRLRASAARMTLAAAGLGLELPGLEVEAADDGAVRELSAAAAPSTWRVGERSATIPAPALGATLVAAGEDRLRLRLRPRLGAAGSGELEVEWQRASGRLTAAAGGLRGISAGMWVPGLAVDAVADLELRGEGGELVLAATSRPRSVAAADGAWRIDTAAGEAALSLRLPFAELSLAGPPPAAGRLEGRWRLPSVSGRLGGLEVPPSLAPLDARLEGVLGLGREPRLTGTLAVTSAAGEWGFSGTLDAAALDGEWSLRGAAPGTVLELLHRAGAAPPIPGVELGGELSASGRLAGSLDAPRIDGELHWSELRAAGGEPAWNVTAGRAAVGWRWPGGDAAIELRQVTASGTLARPPVRPVELRLSARGEVSSDLSAARLESLVLESVLGRLEAHGDWRRDGVPRAAGGVRAEGLRLTRWQDTLAPAVDISALEGFALQGEARARLDGTLAADGAWHAAGEAEVAGAGFTSADGARVLEGLDSRWRLQLGGGSGGATELSASGEVGGFLLLWNTFFGDFSSVTAELSASGRADASGWQLGGRLAVPEGPLAAVSLERRGAGQALAAELALELADLTATHRRYLAAVLAEPFGRLTLGGAARLRAAGTWGPEEPAGTPWSLAGEVVAEDLRFASGGGEATVEGLDLTLPVDLRHDPGAQRPFHGPRRHGHLAFDRLAVRDLELPSSASGLWVEGDSIGLEEALELAILGGSVALERLTAERLLESGRSLESGLRLRGLRLERIAEALDLLPLEGALDGHLPRLWLAGDELRVEGGGRVAIFGGTVEVHDISGRDVFSPYPRLILSADFHDIDLGQVTRRFDFGEMTGIVAGSVEGCELFRGVPLRFAAHLATVPRPDMPRTLDVKAVNNLTILGTGVGTGFLDRGIRRFLKHYTYDRLGVALSLADDRLLLRGLEQRGERELFLKGRLPFPIDVVNAQPGRTVGFQTMVRRLQSLDFSAVTTRP